MKIIINADDFGINENNYGNDNLEFLKECEVKIIITRLSTNKRFYEVMN